MPSGLLELITCRAVTQASPESQREQLSPDGRWRWDGTQWVPAQGAPQWVPPQGAPPIPGGPQGTTPAPGPAAGFATPAATGGIAHQFTGNALWSIVFGVASVAVPFFTPIYFPILPIFGLWRGVLAVRTGRLVGGGIGLVINAIGCIVSLLASGLLDSALR